MGCGCGGAGVPASSSSPVSPMTTSIIYLTNRQEPKFEWFVDSLYNQTTEEDRQHIELIVVDSVLNVDESSRRQQLTEKVAGRFAVNHVKPQDNFYQGPNRKTKTEMFSPANARNTGVKYASAPYIVFVDDVSVLMPSWWPKVKQLSGGGSIVCGSYQKHFEMNVESGHLVSSRQHQAGMDSRWNIGIDGGTVQIAGTQLFGSSVGMPKEIFNQMGGFDDLCDSIGGEDYQFGIRLTHARHKIFYDRQMFTIESEELHNQPYLMLRDDRVLSPDAYMERLRQLGINRRYADGNWDSSHMILDILYGTEQIKPYGAGDGVKHWFDGKLLNEL